MISHKHEFIFIQIPKTACTSVQNALRKYGCGNIKQGKNSWDKVDFKHITFGEETRFFPLGYPYYYLKSAFFYLK